MNTLKIEKLRNGEFIAVGKDFITFIEAANPATLALGANYTSFKTTWEELDSFFMLERGSILTDDLVALDGRRDDALVGIRTVAAGYARHFNANTKAASERVLACIDKYGSAIQNQNMLAETETLRNLVADFETDVLVSNALTVLNLTAWVTELKDANNAFNQVYLQRTQEASEKPDDSLATKRKPAIDAYRKLIKTLDAKDTLDPSPALSSLMNKLNELIDKYNQLIANRSGGKDKGTDPAPQS
jgi:hypothetical protein